MNEDEVRTWITRGSIVLALLVVLVLIAFGLSETR
jgi:hypothetical protein